MLFRSLPVYEALLLRNPDLESGAPGASGDGTRWPIQLEYDARLEDLRAEAAARPLLQFTPWAPDQQPQNVPGFYPVYPPQHGDARGPIRELVQTLALRTSARIANGENDLSELFLALRLAEGIKELPQSAIYYHEIILHCVQPIYDGIASRAWKNDELKKIQDRLDRKSVV